MSDSAARVLAVLGPSFLVRTGHGGCLCCVSRRLEELPVVGDFVELDGQRIRAIQPRRSAISRREPGAASRVQVMAANVDVLFIVSGLDGDFNLRRLERYLVLAVESGTAPVFVLTKADICAEAEQKRQLVQAVAPNVEVILSGLNDETVIHRLRELLPAGVTGALIGSSGAGKSTLLNRLMGAELQTVREVRLADARGRHTTTHRQLFPIPGGGWILDQPGLREIQITASEQDVEAAFDDIRTLSAHCRFRDCKHEGEPGCAVAGNVDAVRLRSFGKLRREAQRAEEETDFAARQRKKQWIKQVHRAMRRSRSWDE